jgi:hypothetical protein
MDRATPGDREKAQTLLGEVLLTYTFIEMPHHIEMTEALLDQRSCGLQSDLKIWLAPSNRAHCRQQARVSVSK